MSLMYGNSAVPKGVSISCRVVRSKTFKPTFDSKSARYLLTLACAIPSTVAAWLIFSLAAITEIIFNSRYW